MKVWKMNSSNSRLETTILNNLIHNEDYARRVIPFLQADYFQDFTEKSIFQAVYEYVDKYKSVPDIEALTIDIQKIQQLESKSIEEKINIDKMLDTENPDDPCSKQNIEMSDDIKYIQSTDMGQIDADYDPGF